MSNIGGMKYNDDGGNELIKKMQGMSGKIPKKKNFQWKSDPSFLENIKASFVSGPIDEETIEVSNIMPEPVKNLEENVQSVNDDDIDIIRKSLDIIKSSERIRIIVIAINKLDAYANEVTTIKCNGDPLGCYAYNSVQDCYYINCVSYVDLGPISVSYKLKTPVGVDASSIIALPEEIIEKYLSPVQKKNLKSFREKYKAECYNIQFMQSINC